MDSIPVRERFLPVLDERTDAPKDRIPVDCGTGCKANRGQRDDLSAMINGLRSSPVPASSACWRFLHKNHPTEAPASNPNKCAQLSIPGTIHPAHRLRPVAFADQFLPQSQEKPQRSPRLDRFDRFAIDARRAAVTPHLFPSNLNLIENASQVVETVIHEIGHQTLEQILVLSAEQVAGARTPGKASGEIRYHGSQPGRVQLADRKVKVKRPRLRHKTKGEVKIPAYEKLRQDRGLAQHLLGALLRGVSTREYAEVLPQMAETVGVSRSAISRQAVEASVEQMQQLQERRWEGVEILVIYIDGQRFAEQHVISAVGVDAEGQKHILGIEPGATENAAAVKR